MMSTLLQPCHLPAHQSAGNEAVEVVGNAAGTPEPVAANGASTWS